MIVKPELGKFKIVEPKVSMEDLQARCVSSLGSLEHLMAKCQEILRCRDIHVVSHARKMCEETLQIVRAIAKDC